MESPPTNLEAEEAVIGALMIDTDAIYHVKSIMQPGDFHIAKHRVIYEAILGLHQDGTPADTVTLTERIERDGNLAAIGGASALTDFMARTPTSAHAEHYAGLVREASLRRALIEEAGQIAKDAWDSGNELQQVLTRSRERITGVERGLVGKDDGLALRASLDAYLDLLQVRDRDKDKPKLQLPWDDLAHLMPFLSEGTLVAILADPGAGKTAFMETCAERWARLEWKIAFFHLELSAQMMLDRRMQRHTGIPIKRLQLGGQLEPEDYTKIIQATERMNTWKGELRYFHCPGWPMHRIVSTVQRLHDSDGIDVVILDYLNKVPLADRGGGQNSAQMRGADIEDFKTMLEELGIVGLMAAQFDKSSKRARRRTLADARDTGELEDKANVGIVIDRPRDEANVMTDSANVSIVKCNAGMAGTVQMVFKGEHLTFAGLEWRDKYPDIG